MQKRIRKSQLLFAVLIGAVVSTLSGLYIDRELILWFTANGALVGLVVGIWHGRGRATQSERNAIEKTKKAIEPELHGLPEPVTSLFLFNTLHNIAALIMFDPQKAAETVEQLANFIRSVSELKKKNQTFLGEEFKAVDLYLKIEKARLGDRLQPETNFSEVCLEIPFPSLTLFPFVDNAIRYGAEILTDPVSIKIACHQEGKHLVIELEDSVQNKNAEAIDSGLREKVFHQAKLRLQSFFGSGVKCSRRPIYPHGEHLTISIPLNSAVIARYGISHIPHSETE